MPTGTPRSYHKKFKFLVEIDGVASARFAKCSALEGEIAKIEHHEGGDIIADKSPGRLSFSDITLERGATDDHDLWDWFNSTANGGKNAGLVAPTYERTVDIVQLDLDGSERRRWTLYRAWPTKFVAGEWDNGADENTMETVTLTFKYPDLDQK